MAKWRDLQGVPAGPWVVRCLGEIMRHFYHNGQDAKKALAFAQGSTTRLRSYSHPKSWKQTLAKAAQSFNAKVSWTLSSWTSDWHQHEWKDSVWSEKWQDRLKPREVDPSTKKLEARFRTPSRKLPTSTHDRHLLTFLCYRLQQLRSHSCQFEIVLFLDFASRQWQLPWTRRGV